MNLFRVKKKLNVENNLDIKRKLIKYIIVLYPLLDIIYSINYFILKINLPINQIIRMLILLYFLIIIINNKKSKFIIAFIGMILLIEEIYYKFMGFSPATGDSNYIFKILLFIVYVYSFQQILKDQIVSEDKLTDYMIISSIIISISIIFTTLIGIGFSTYLSSNRAIGHTGLFTIQNGLTAVLLMLLSIFIYKIMNAKNTKQKCYYSIALLLSIITLFIMKTKSGMVGCVGVVFIEFIYYLIKKHCINKKVLTILLLCIILIIIIFRNSIFNNIGYYVSKFNFQYFITYLTSNRDSEIKIIWNYINSLLKNNPFIIFTGVGYTKLNSILHYSNSQMNSIEMDYFGLLFYSGTIILMIILIIILKRIFNIIKLLIKCKFNDYYFAIFVSLIIGFIHSFLGGHVIYEAFSSLYFAIFLGTSFYLYYKDTNNI